MDLRYPIGKFEMGQQITEEKRQKWIEKISEAPARLREAVQGLTEEQLDTPYRPGGWTVRQVVHHLADSHMTSFIRFKLALTEEEPLIKPYDEAKWAELEDSRGVTPELSLSLLDVLHQRWVILLSSMSDSDYQRAFRHPEIGTVTLEKVLGLYAWHGLHHIAHITSLSERME
jgi:uncharacterized damage-inducible protein DinB